MLLDGAADFIPNPNDPDEAFAFVDELHQLAIRYDTAIICVIHENPSSETGKTRGHFGSQLERKAETNLRLSKDGDGVTTVFAEKARHAHIPKERGTRFVWSDEEKMHVTTEAKPKGRPKAFEPEDILELMGDGLYTRAEVQRLCQADGWKQGTFRTNWKALKNTNRIVESSLERNKWARRLR